jgi:tRNA(His) guanylyltransferase
MGRNKSLKDRMKDYESCYGFKIPNRSYIIVRLDGRGFSKYTDRFEKPFDSILSNAMDSATIELCKEFSPAFAYTQSDEVSLVFSTIDNIDAETIFDGKLQKLCSLTAAKMTASFNKIMLRLLTTLKYTPDEILEKLVSGNFPEIDAVFDSRVFVVPDIREVSNYFIWRQQDCTRNSVSMAASANFSHKLLEGRSSSDKQEMLFQEKGINWNDYDVKYKRGLVIKRTIILIPTSMPDTDSIMRNKWLPDYKTPIFSQETDYLYSLIPTYS